MEFKDVASVSGKSGLYKVLKPTRTGVILESMDESKSKLVTSLNARVSILDEVSIYTNTKEGSVSLKEVLRKIYKEFDSDPGVDAKSSPEELKAFLKFILPDFDENRVYPSDIKKLVQWYKTLYVQAPELLKEEVKKEKPKKSVKKKKESGKTVKKKAAKKGGSK
jgi:hypothetical protein